MFPSSSRAPARLKRFKLSGELSEKCLVVANRRSRWGISGGVRPDPFACRHPDNQLCAARVCGAGSVTFFVNGQSKAGGQLLQRLPNLSLQRGATHRSRSHGLVIRQCSSIFSASKFSLILCFSRASEFVCQDSPLVQND